MIIYIVAGGFIVACQHQASKISSNSTLVFVFGAFSHFFLLLLLLLLFFCSVFWFSVPLIHLTHTRKEKRVRARERGTERKKTNCAPTKTTQHKNINSFDMRKSSSCLVFFDLNKNETYTTKYKIHEWFSAFSLSITLIRVLFLFLLFYGLFSLNDWHNAFAAIA